MTLTHHRTLQYIGILLALAALATGYWYFSVRASTKLQSSQAGSLTNGLVGQWSMDGQDVNWSDTYEVKDTSGNANDGDSVNMSTASVVPGRIGQALTFDGVNQQISIGTVAAFGNQATRTISTWIKPSGLTTYRGIVGAGVGSFQICSNDGTDCPGTTGRLVYYHTFSGTDGKWILGVDSVKANEWAHVVVTYDRSSTSNDPVIYVNGVSQSVTELTTPTGTADSEVSFNVSIGYDGYAYAMGAIDDVRIYNRVLSAAEIAGLYDMGKVKLDTRPGDDVLEEGLAGYWKLDESSGTSAADASGNASTGTLTNMEDPGDWVAGQVGPYALDFDGTNEYLSVTDPASGVLDFDVRGTGGGQDLLTLTGWFNRDTFANDHTVVAKKNDQSTGIGYIVWIDGTDDRLWVQLYGDNAVASTIASSRTFTATGWHHFAVVIGLEPTGGDQPQIYIDGTNDSDLGTGSGYQHYVWDMSNALAFRIAAESDAGNPFDGKIDEVRVYHRALSAEEVALLYRETHPDDPDTHLVGHWTFDGTDVSGTTAIDRGRGGNVGTLSGSPAVSPGRLGQALRFDGTDDYVSVAHSSSINLSNTISISFWVKNSVTQEYNRQIAKEPGGGGGSYGWAIYGNGGYVELSTSGGNPGLNSTDFGPALYDGSWHHIVWTLDNGNWTYTRDGGVITGSGTYAHGTGFGNTNPLVIGKHGVTASEYFLGALDDVRIYDTALTATQIVDLYRAGGGKAIAASSGNDTLRSGLVGQWSLDGQDVDWSATTTEVKDDSGNANHGDATNMSAASAAPGRIGQALNFDGVNDYVDAGDPVALRDIEDQGGGGMSISAWIKPRTSGGSGKGHIVGKSNNDSGAGDGSWGLSVDTSSNRLSFAHSRATQPIAALINNGWVANQWEHIVVTFNGGTVAATAIGFYIDGALQGTHTYDQDGSGAFVSDAGNTFFIGAGDTGGWYFDGAIDDVRVYNRVITAAEVTQLYNLGR